MASRIVGVLALQGAFREHCDAIEACGDRAIKVKSKKDLSKCSSLIIPGGESTVIMQFLDETCLGKEIVKRAKKGMPVFGTCAGALVLCAKVVREKRYKPLCLVDAELSRNAYGRQVDSFESKIIVKGLDGNFDAIFIRAPIINRIWGKAVALASFNKKIVLARQGKILVSTFHPELTSDLRLHKYFLSFAEE